MFHPASSASIGFFLLVCGFVLAAFFRGIWSSEERAGRSTGRCTAGVVVGTFLWLGLLAGLVGSGWVQAAPARLPIFGALVMLGSLGIGISPIGKWLSMNPVGWLLAFQGFRLPLELVLHSWVEQGVIPQTMTWTGSNWDILSGIVALGLAPFCRRSLAAAWLGNALGFLLLLNVGRVAVFSAPVPFGWKEVTPKLELPLHLPYALILPVCVGGALIGHIALTRALLRQRTHAGATTV